ncbi:MAG: flavodoxin family protein [Fibromonadaceae bacterium]|jgi:multimeric flavodoxin WrbA|nr:flavodoxin family protein [Fibromonadaceae bacterium]
MKVILINGSPRKNGCTYTALCEVASELNKNGMETEIFQLGSDAVPGCSACGFCFEKGKCKTDDIVNEFAELSKTADGFVFGSPVHFAGAGGKIISFMDRLFYSARANLANKPAAAITSSRRGGATAAFDQLNKYFTISNMPIVSSQYWNMVHGSNPEQVKQDLEGMQTMRRLGANMAWLLKCIEAGKKAGIEIPKAEPWARTDFMR